MTTPQDNDEPSVASAGSTAVASRPPYYKKDGITIYHGDCREILPLIECNAIVSDPPYGMAVDTGKLNRIGKPRYGEWHDVEHSGGVAVEAILAKNVNTILFGANGYASRLPSHPGWIVWDKQADGFRQGSPAELAWSNCLPNIRMFRMNYRGFTTRSDPKFHPMQKPVSLMRWVIGFPEVSSGVVCDPYMGSGSTLVACKAEGRRAVGIEIEERYCEIAAKRLSQGVLF